MIELQTLAQAVPTTEVGVLGAVVVAILAPIALALTKLFNAQQTSIKDLALRYQTHMETQIATGEAKDKAHLEVLGGMRDELKTMNGVQGEILSQLKSCGGVRPARKKT